jgi:hypothetical protein
VADAALQLKHGVEAPCREALQLRLLGGEGFGNDPLCRAVHTDVGDGIKPVDQLDIEIFQIAEAPAQEEVLADIADRPLDLPLVLAR